MIFCPNAQPPVARLEATPRATLAVVQSRRAPGFFASVRELCDDLLGRLHAAVEIELQSLFGDIGPVRPFDLITGEERTVNMNQFVISEGSLPKIPDNPHHGGS